MRAYYMYLKKKINKVIKINFCLKIISKTIATQIPI